jgi:protein-disulfide isomerase-like protein with CxxC motif
MTAVDFYFDPLCPWTWITSRWLVSVAPERNLDITWRTFSLLHHNRNNDIPEQYRAPMQAQWRGLRVIEAARAGYGNDAVGRLYTEFGEATHLRGDSTLATLETAVAAADVDASVLAHADDDSWDHGIRDSTEAGAALVGSDVGIPIIHIAGARSVFFGPVMSPAPTGEDALKAWDAFALLTEVEGVYEVKRSRHVGPQFS